MAISLSRREVKPPPFLYPSIQGELSIRVLKILSGEDHHPVHIELREISLTDCPVPPFKALSYTWGSPEKSNVIMHGTSSICVTDNALAALVYFRRKSHSTDLFWIDAICINQDDLEERSFQVRLMSRIYRQAKEILVWLHDPNPPHPPNRSEWIIARKPVPAALPSTAPEPNTLPMKLLRIFSNSWFMRVWVLQEVVLGKDIMVLSGRTRKPWDEVLDIVLEYLDRDTEDPRNTAVDEPVELSMVMMTVMNDGRNEVASGSFELSFTDLFHRSKFCGATEPKDKIFALLSLASDVDVDVFRPDYKLLWPDICIKLTRHTISQSNTLDILRSVGLGSKTLELPSWVPDFSQIGTSVPLAPYSATSSKLEPAPDVTSFCNQSIMVVKCLLLHDIIRVASPWIDEGDAQNPSLLSLFPLLDQWYDGMRNHQLYADDAHKRINTFWGAVRMTLGSEASEQHIDEVYDAGEGWHWHFRKLLGIDAGHSQPEDSYNFCQEPTLDDGAIFDLDMNPNLLSPWARNLMFKPLMAHLHGRTFGFMDDGKVALLPRDTQEGDHLCLLYGCRLPFVVRSCGEGYHELVGAAYLHQHLNWEVFEEKKSWEQLPWITFRWCILIRGVVLHGPS